MEYIPTTGDFYWIKPKRGRSELAGTINQQGYLIITINDRKYVASKLAWYFINGEYPEHLIGYKDGDSGNLRWGNLKIHEPGDRTRNYRDIGDKYSMSPEIMKTKVVVKAKFTNEQVNKAVEDFMSRLAATVCDLDKDKELINGRYVRKLDSKTSV